MLRKFVVVSSVLVFAFGILFASVLRTAAVKYDFSPVAAITTQAQVLGEDTTVNIDYELVYAGKILPDSPVWLLKALRDKLWLLVTTNPSRRAELNLLFADKRVSMSKQLFEKGKFEEGYSTLTKAAKYLEEASNQEITNREAGIDTNEFLQRMALASLKHYQVMEELKEMAPEDAKPMIVSTQDYTKRAYEQARNALLEKRKTPPENPFDWN